MPCIVYLLFFSLSLSPSTKCWLVPEILDKAIFLYTSLDFSSFVALSLFLIIMRKILEKWGKGRHEYSGRIRKSHNPSLCGRRSVFARFAYSWEKSPFMGHFWPTLDRHIFNLQIASTILLSDSSSRSSSGTKTSGREGKDSYSTLISHSDIVHKKHGAAVLFTHAALKDVFVRMRTYALEETQCVHTCALSSPRGVVAVFDPIAAAAAAAFNFGFSSEKRLSVSCTHTSARPFLRRRIFEEEQIQFSC